MNSVYVMANAKELLEVYLCKFQTLCCQLKSIHRKSQPLAAYLLGVMPQCCSNTRAKWLRFVKPNW
jgi:hypothetical protein